VFENTLVSIHDLILIAARAVKTAALFLSHKLDRFLSNDMVALVIVYTILALVVLL
jgi:hypothetical protein